MLQKKDIRRRGSISFKKKEKKRGSTPDGPSTSVRLIIGCLMLDNIIDGNEARASSTLKNG
jgi:hypothetical protein